MPWNFLGLRRLLTKNFQKKKKRELFDSPSLISHVDETENLTLSLAVWVQTAKGKAGFQFVWTVYSQGHGLCLLNADTWEVKKGGAFHGVR